jgi:hypothetical protein
MIKMQKMDSLDNGLKQLRKRVPASDTTALYDSVIRKALQPAPSLIQFDQLKRVAAAVAALVLINASVVFWSLSKSNADTQADPNAYLQSFNLSIY